MLEKSMLKEMKGLEYTLEVLRAFDKDPSERDSNGVYSSILSNGKIQNASKSYVQKILPRMVRANLLASETKGYRLIQPVDSITVNMVLDICDMPNKESPLYKFVLEMKQGVSLSGIKEFYDFS